MIDQLYILGALAAALLSALAFAFNKGKNTEKARQTKADNDRLKTRNEIEDEVAKTDPDTRRDELGRWVHRK